MKFSAPVHNPPGTTTSVAVAQFDDAKSSVGAPYFTNRQKLNIFI